MFNKKDSNPPLQPREILNWLEKNDGNSFIDFLLNQELMPNHKIPVWFFKHYRSVDLDNKLWNVILNYQGNNLKQQLKEKLKNLLDLFIREALENNDESMIIAAITSQHRWICLNIILEDKSTTFLLSLFNRLNEKTKSIVSKELIQYGLEKYNAPLLTALKNHVKPADFDETIKSLNLSSEKSELLNVLLSLEEKEASYIFNKMKPFVFGYGHIQYDDALLAWSQINKRKNYSGDDSLVILNLHKNLTEFTDFLHLAAAADKPFKKRFLCACGHYYSGEISVDKDGLAKIWILDSLGLPKEENITNLLCEAELIEFSHIFPKNDIYVSLEKRQQTRKGCSVFSLDDVAHLKTLRLPEQYSESGIWGYLSLNSQHPLARIEQLPDESTGTTIQVKICPVPVSLMRTTQSLALFTEDFQARGPEEQKLIINKNNETTSQSSSKFFQFNPLANKKQNKRLDYKFDKMIKNIFHYLRNHSPEEIEQNKHKHTLDALHQSQAKVKNEPHLWMIL